MNVEPYMHLVPEIERKIRDLDLDSLVLGLGPTAWLVRWIDRKLLNGLRLWAAHDFGRVLPVDDLWIFDGPGGRIAPGTDAFRAIVEARPRRLYIYEPHAHLWEPFLHRPVLSVLRKVKLLVLQNGPQRNGVDPKDWPAGPSLDARPCHTLYVSPTGITTFAWAEGCRRIGVLGVECRIAEHHSAQWAPAIDKFFVAIANQAHARSGVVANLSPLTHLRGFAAWTPQSASSSEPTRNSATPAPNSCSNTASGATPPAMTSRSSGCALEIPGSRSAATAQTEPGASETP